MHLQLHQKIQVSISQSNDVPARHGIAVFNNKHYDPLLMPLLAGIHPTTIICRHTSANFISWLGDMQRYIYHAMAFVVLSTVHHHRSRQPVYLLNGQHEGA